MNFLGCPVLETLRQIIILLYIYNPKFFCLSVLLGHIYFTNNIWLLFCMRSRKYHVGYDVYGKILYKLSELIYHFQIWPWTHTYIVIILILDHYYVVMVKTVYNQIYIVYLASSWGILNILTTAVKVGLEVLSFWMNRYYSFWKDTLTWWSSKEIFFLDAKIIFYSWWLEKISDDRYHGICCGIMMRFVSLTWHIGMPNIRTKLGLDWHLSFIWWSYAFFLNSHIKAYRR